MLKKLRLFLMLLLLTPFLTIAQKLKRKTSVEEVPKICEGLAFANKPMVAIMPFKLAAPGVAGNVGTGVSDMLMNAIFNSGCFRVVERERLDDIMQEQGLSLSGAGDENSFAKVGKLSGADIMVFGTITEFKENESGGGGGGGAILRRSPLGAVVGGVGAKTAHLGYTLKFVNPSSGEVLDMKSFDKKRTSVGVAGAGLFGAALGGGVFYSSKSMQDALEESLIDAITYMGQNKEAYAGVVSDRKTAMKGSAKVNKEDCALMKGTRRPKVMIIIPEEHLAGAGSRYNAQTQRYDIYLTSNGGGSGGSNSDDNDEGNSGRDNTSSAASMFRPPDPAGETEIMKRFLEFGFEVVDAKQFEKLKESREFKSAFSSPTASSHIGAQFGADIVLVGEAFSEYSKSDRNMTSCRARVEVKAILTNSARVLAADGLHGSGLDVSEIIAGKTALKNAGDKIADYFLEQLCGNSAEIAAAMNGGTKKSSAGTSAKESEIEINKADFTAATNIGKLLTAMPGVMKAERVSYSDNTVKFKITHSADFNSIIDKLVNNKQSIKLDVKTVEDNFAKMEITKKVYTE